jgi:predicted TIM-barrel fold metal-dependent hydrolase
MRNARGRTDWPVIDIHCHTSHTDPSTADSLAAAARQFGVRHALLLGDVYAYGANPTPDQVRLINDGTRESIKRYPDFFSGMCFTNPQNPPEFLREEIGRCVRDLGFIGVKLETSLRARDRRMDPIMETARELKLPVLQHAWYKSEADNELESTPADVADLAARFPDVTIIMAHLGGCRIQGVLDVAALANVSVDTSGSQPITGIVEYAVATLGPDRVLYGTEAPGRDFAAQIGRVLGARISDAARARILHGNSERIFGLKV